MAIERRPAFISELLVRFNSNLTVRGRHIKTLEQLVDTETGEVVTERESEALPVGTEHETAVALDAALSRLGAQLSAAEEAERQRRTAAETERDAARAERDAALQLRDNALAALDAAAIRQAADAATTAETELAEQPVALTRG